MYLINLDGLSLLIGIVVTCFLMSNSNPIVKALVLSAGVSIAIAITLMELIS